MTLASDAATTRRRIPPRFLAIAVLAALAIGAGFVGAAIDRMLLRARVAAAIAGDTTYHSLSSALRSPTDADRQARVAQLTTALDLTPAQGDEIDSVMVRRAGEFRALREEIRPRVESLVGAVRDDIERVLTPAQRQRFLKLESSTPSQPQSGPHQ